MEPDFNYDSANIIDLNKHCGEDEIDASRGVNSCSEIEIDETDGVDDGMENEKEKENRLKEPYIGMEFNCVDDIFEYYKNYGNQKGFPVKRRSSKKGNDGVHKWVAISCAREGKLKSKCKNSLKLQPSSKTNCDAKLNAVLCPDGKWKLTSVYLKHNHLLSPGKTRYYKTSRVINSFTKRKLEVNDMAGVRPNKSFNACVVEAGGNENVPFLMKDCYNYLNKIRRLRLGEGDAEAVHNYFVKMQANNANFFYSMDFDEESRIKNLFWADARSRAAYEEFGDVVTFDTTYLTNKYDMPFAPFVGVNHHGQSILLGCGLISKEDTDAFTWLFKSWLKCMNGRAPDAIITDQDRAMKNAIEIVFPNIRHRWCLWHIMKKLPEKLKGYNEYDSMKSAIQRVVYNSLSTTEFETSWNKLIDDFKLEGNDWLLGLYLERHRWVPAFVKNSFWAGMSTTQRSESMNSFFDGYVHSKTTLKQFVEQYENALRTKVGKESQADYGSFNATIPCVTKYKVEKQFQGCYTTEKFKEAQDEVKGKVYCIPSLVREDEGIEVYKVSEDMVGEMERVANFTVFFKHVDCEVKCNCNLFEFRGILCRHCLTVLIQKNIHILPDNYILRRWRKDVKRCHTKIKIIYSNWAMNPENERCDILCNSFSKVLDLVTNSEEKTKMVMDWIKWLINEVENGDGACLSSQHTPLMADQLDTSSCGGNVNGNTQENANIRSPLITRGKGRPPSKRKEGMTEKAVKKKKNKMSKEKGGVLHGSQSKEIASHVPRGSQHKESGSYVPYVPLNASDLHNETTNSQVQAYQYPILNDISLSNFNDHFDPFWKFKEN